MGNGGVRSRWAFVSWLVAAALFAGAVGGAVALPAGAADAQGSAPAASGSMPSVELSAGGAARSVAVGGYFSGAVASYGAASSDSAVVGVSVSGSTVTVTPESAGSATVTVTAANSAGSASQAFAVKVLPAGCVVALGALAAGSVTTKAGSWERDDGCRATNGAGAAGRYARYYTFTVSEAQEAWFRLSSSQANRLYLLEGAGTGGRVLGAAGTAGATWSASLWRALQPGAYTLETTAFRAAREAAFSVSVDSMPLTPPESCVVSLGAVSAGTAAARSGAWDRDDACRSVNATANLASRYYAAYASFTVAEPFEARFELSSSRGTRLYLLEGAGAGGRVLASSSSRTGASPAAFRRTLQPGTYTLEATTYLAAAEAAYTLKVSSPPAAPQPAGALAAQTLPAGDSADVDVASGFNGRIDAYTAASSDTNVATVTAQGSVLTLTGIAAGTATVTVTATNAAGSAAQSFAVTVTSAAPKAAGALAAPTITAGDSAEVDAAGAFTGAVDTYAATSSNAAVVDVALDGSTLTLTGIAAGAATVTVTAANAAGSAAQSFTVTVSLPPAPTLGAPLAARTLQATETLTVDVAAGFAGRIDTYAAAVGDTDTVTVTVDGSQVTLTGAAAGSTTVTVTAINAAGRAARSFAVTVNALTAPRTAGTPIARTIAVGEEIPIHIADAFSGIVHAYAAASSDTTKLTATVDGSTVTLVGAAAGSATVTLTAANAAGSASATLPVTVEVPDGLAVAVAAPSHCLGSEGAPAPGGGRRGVGHIDVTYHVTGGAPPYTITSPDAPNTVRTEPTGTLRIPCARRGTDLAAASPEVNVVEAGPRTLTVTATDNTATTASADIRIEVAEDAYSTAYNDGLMHPGKTYVLGTPDEWVLLTLPQGLTLQFSGLSEGQRAHFTEPATGAEIILNWYTGTEVRRHIPGTVTGGTTATTSREQTARQSVAPQISPDIRELFNTLVSTTPLGLTYTVSPRRWRPYQGLPNRTVVGVNSKLREGKTLKVCIKSKILLVNSDNDSEVWLMPTTYLENRRIEWLRSTQVGALRWNTLLEVTDDDPRDGSYSKAFEVVNSCTEDHDIEFVLATDVPTVCGHDPTVDLSPPPYACADNQIQGSSLFLGEPPLIAGTRIYVPTLEEPSGEWRDFVATHELGHFIGLGDYGPCSRANSVMAVHVPETSACGSPTSRDLADTSAIYRPARRVSVGLRLLQEVIPIGVPLGNVRRFSGGLPPRYEYVDEGSREISFVYVDNAYRYLIYARNVGSFSAPNFSDPLTIILEPSKMNTDDFRYEIPKTDAMRTKEIVVVGITRGDPKRNRSLSKGVQHSTVYVPVSELPLDGTTQTRTNGVMSIEWTLGDPVVLRWPFESDTIPVVSNPDMGPPRDEPSAVILPFKGPEFCPTDDGFSWVLRAGVGGGWWCDRVEVSGDGVVSTTIHRCDVAGGELRVGDGGAQVCAREVPGAVRSRPGPPGCSAGFSLVAVLVGGVPQQVCSKIDSVPAASASTPSCPPGYTLVTVQGQVCHRSVPAKASTEYSCSAGYSLVAVPLGGRVCRKSLPASSSTKYSCPAGYTLVTVQGRVCHRSVPAAASTEYSCSAGYSLVAVPLGGRVCRKSLAASSSTKYVCRSGYSLVTTVVPFGTPLRQCKKSLPAKATAKYVCRSGYSLARIPLGGQYCRKSTAASASYSCGSGYTRSGATCYKYIYSSPTGTRCPSGYALIYNGLYYRCRKRLTAAATVTYSCSSGTLSGSQCVLTATPASVTVYSCSSGILSGSKCVLTATPTLKTTYSCSSGTLSGSKCVLTASPTSRTVYSCSSGTLSGSKCVLTATPTLKTTYSCSSGTLSGSKCVLTATPTLKTTYSCSSGRLSGSTCVLTATPTFTVAYDCDDAPAGYTLSGQNCVKTTTRTPNPTTEHYCDPGYELDAEDNTCSRTITTEATKITTYGCPDGEPPYRLAVTVTATTTTRTCTRTITIAAETGRPTCPTPPDGQRPYKLTVTDRDGQTTYNCTNDAGDADDETLPPPL